MEIDLQNVKDSMQSVKTREMECGETIDSRQLFFKLQKVILHVKRNVQDQKRNEGEANGSEKTMENCFW